MNKLRSACLAVTFAILLVNPQIILSATSGSCQALEDACEEFCENVGGMQTTSTSDIFCTETCFCNGKDEDGFYHNFTVGQQFCFEMCID
jgi:hypothetical protein